MDLHPQLNRLETTGLLRLAQVQPDLEYLFRHALVQDAAYASLLKADRKWLHRVVGETLERLYPDRLDELAPLLARHFQGAGAPDQARYYFTRAADGALSHYANAEAERYYRAALALAEPGGGRAGLLAGLGEALANQSRFADALATWRAAIDLYAAAGDADHVARLYARSARVAADAGDPPWSLRLAQEGLAALAGGAETRGQAALLRTAASAYHLNGRSADALPLCRQGLALAERLGDREEQAESLTTLGLLPNQPVAAQMAALTRAVELAESAGLLAAAARAHNNLAVIIENSVGDLAAARDHYQRAVALARRRGSAAHELLYLHNVISVALWSGDLAGAGSTIAAGRELLRTLGQPAEGTRALRLSEAALLRYRGELGEALRRLRACQAGAQLHGDLQISGIATNYLAEILFEQGDWPAAAGALDDALAISDQGLGWGGVEPRCLLSAVYARQGEAAGAQRLLDAARAQAGDAPGPYEAKVLALAAGRLALAEGRRDAALAAFADAAALDARLGMPWYRARTLQEWAAAHLARGTVADYDRTVTLLQEALAIFEQIGVPYYAGLVRAQLPSRRPEG
ncbi:MAG TPA: hypothetical protein VKY74_24445 [Chloroflexia bacterium]|nr:hypothetical protein [Chloroflexia bacterium]